MLVLKVPAIESRCVVDAEVYELQESQFIPSGKKVKVFSLHGTQAGMVLAEEVQHGLFIVAWEDC